jgi:Protein of unknown function (DUF4199)
MNPILGAGVLIGVLCGVWMFVTGVAGWYKDPVMANAFYLVIAIEIAGLVWGLRRTAREGRTYGGQIVAGTLMAIIAGVIIVVCSLVFTMLAFPDYFQAREAMDRRTLQAQGRSDREIVQMLSDEQATRTPMSEAMDGFIGTLVTGILSSAVIAIWIRTRSAPKPVM